MQLADVWKKQYRSQGNATGLATNRVKLLALNADPHISAVFGRRNTGTRVMQLVAYRLKCRGKAG